VIKDIERLFKQGEGLTLEFKEAENSLPKNVFETICAFLNTEGGTILLGVADDGTVKGIDPSAVQKIKTDLVNLSNNPQKINPVFVMSVHDIQYMSKHLLIVQVPESSQIHTCKGVIHIRREEGDYKIERPEQIAGIVNRKASYFSEQKVLPYTTLEDFRPDLFEKASRPDACQPVHPPLGRT